MAHGGQFANKNPNTAHMDQRGAKIFEIYSSGKSGPAPNQGSGASHIGSNVSTGSGGHSGAGHSSSNQTHQNSFL